MTEMEQELSYGKDHDDRHLTIEIVDEPMQDSDSETTELYKYNDLKLWKSNLLKDGLGPFLNTTKL